MMKHVTLLTKEGLTLCTYLVEPLLRDLVNDNGLHRRHVSEANLRDVESAEYVCPTPPVRRLQSTHARRTQLTFLRQQRQSA